MSNQYIIGIDLGTTRTKTGLFNMAGELVRLDHNSYPVHTDGGPGCAEQNPNDWWRVTCQTLRNIVNGIRSEEIAAVCVSGQGPTVVMTDADGRPQCNAMLWMDTRTNAEQATLSKRIGQHISPYSYIPRAMWLMGHNPEAYQRTRWCLSAWDFIALRLSGRAVASTYGDHHPFPQDHLEAGGLRRDLSPPSVPMGAAIGEISPAAIRETGLPAGLLVVAGTNDGMGTLIGAGLTQVGYALDTGGTGGGFALCWNEPLEAKGAFSGQSIVPGQVVIGGSMNALGKSVDWYLDTFEQPSVTHNQLIRRASKVPPGADGLIFLPYLAGERSPILDPQARGVFFGLSLMHNRDHMARAVLESTAFAVRHLAEPIQKAGGKVREMRVTGGQAQNNILSQIKADVLGFPVAIPQVTEAAVLGAAILAGIGAKLFPDLEASSNKMVQITRTIEPDWKRHEYYSQLYSVYKRLYPDLRDAFHELSDLNTSDPIQF